MKQIGKKSKRKFLGYRPKGYYRKSCEVMESTPAMAEPPGTSTSDFHLENSANLSATDFSVFPCEGDVTGANGGDRFPGNTETFDTSSTNSLEFTCKQERLDEDDAHTNAGNSVTYNTSCSSDFSCKEEVTEDQANVGDIFHWQRLNQNTTCATSSDFTCKRESFGGHVNDGDHNYYATCTYVEPTCKDEMINVDGDSSELILNPNSNETAGYHPSIDVDKLKRDTRATLSKASLPENWMLAPSRGVVRFVELSSTDYPLVQKIVDFSLTDLSVSIRIHNRPLPDIHYLYQTYGRKLDPDNNPADILVKLLWEIASYRVCCGNHDDKFQGVLAEDSSSIQISENQSKKSFREGDFGGTTLDGEYYSSTVRSYDCCLLIGNKKIRCRPCIVNRGSLRSSVSRSKLVRTIIRPDRVEPWSKCSFSFLTAAEKEERFKKLTKQNYTLRQTNMKLKALLKKTNAGMSSNEDSQEITDIIESGDGNIGMTEPDDTGDIDICS